MSTTNNTTAANGMTHEHSSAASDVAGSKRKMFIPLENNPSVMNSLARRLGLSPAVSFYDVLSLDDPELIGLLPRPCYALLFIFPGTQASEKAWRGEDAAISSEYNAAGPQEPVLFYRQIIGNACGLVGLLHCATNGSVAAEHIEQESFLEQLIEQVTPLLPHERAQYLHDSEFLAQVHAEAAHKGDSTVPVLGESVPHAYVAFVKGKDGELWELEGRRKGPLQRTSGWSAAAANPVEDLLSETALDMGPRKLLRREDSDTVRFSCLALCPTVD